MAREKNTVCLTGAVLSFILSLGVVGSLITAFQLDIPRMAPVLGICALAAAVSALCFRFKWGGTVLLCLSIPATWLLFRGAQTVEQTFYMLTHILRHFRNAYGWEIPSLLTSYSAPESMFRPVAIVGVLVAAAVSRTVCRGKGSGSGIFAAAVPFALCFVVTDTVPDTKYLFLWMLGITLLVLTGGVRRSSVTQGASLCAMALVPAILALALLFWLVPRETYDKHPQQLQQRIANWIQEIPDLWEKVSDSVAEGISGVVQPTELNLQTLGPRLKKIYPVMEVTAPENGTLYLRGQDYDLYDGAGWTATRHRTENFSRDGVKISSGNVTVVTRRVRDVLYLPYYPGKGITLTGGSLDNSEDLREYSFSQWLLPRDWREQIRDAESSPANTEIRLTLSHQVLPNQSRYLLLPESTRKWAVDLLNNILTDQRTVTGAADAIAQYVRDSAAYDLNTGRMPSDETDFVRWFLEEGETGYCVHFASAATVLLRAAGIEARYVEGYMTSAQAHTQVTVTEDQAHAWAEYYEPVLDAWIVLEATPPDLTADTPATAPEPQPELPTEPNEPSVPEIENTPTRPQPPTQTEGTAPDAPDGPEPPVPTPPSGKWLRRILTGLLVIAAIPAQRQLRLHLRRDRKARRSSNAQMLIAWQELSLACRLLKEAPPEEAEQLAQKAKYSPHRITQEELARMDGFLRDALGRLQEKPWYKQLLFQYVYAAY